MRLLMVGDIAWDILIRPDDEIIWGSDVFGAVRLLPGGSAANVAVWARRLGAEVALRGRLGDDPLGVLMRAHLDSEGAGGGLVVEAGAQTTRVGVLVSRRGERAFITDRATFLPFQPGDLDPALLTGVDLLFLNGYGVFATGSLVPFRTLLETARSRSIPIAFDPSSFELVRAYGAGRLLEELGRADVLLVNQEEAAALAEGATLTSLLDRFALVVVKSGALGAFAISAAGRQSADAEPIEAADTTGAGDAFDAAFLVEYLQRQSVAAALSAGNRLGAYVASRLGAQPPMPSNLCA
jgi:sugar/nucleoside kinase (ribokinase family)